MITKMLSTNNDKFLGLAFGLGGAFFFALMALVVHVSSAEIPSAQLLVARAGGAIIFLLIFTKPRWRELFSIRAKPVWSRSLAGSLAIFCYFITLRRESVAIATVLADTSPVFVLVLLLFGERRLPSLSALVSLIAAVVGVAAISNADVQISANPFIILVALSGAFFAAVAYVSLHQATQKFQPGEIVLTLSICLLLLSFALPSDPWVGVNSHSLPTFAAVASTGLIAQLFMTQSFKRLNPFAATILGFSSSLWGYVFDLVSGSRSVAGTSIAGFSLLFLAIIMAKGTPVGERGLTLKNTFKSHTSSPSPAQSAAHTSPSPTPQDLGTP